MARSAGARDKARPKTEVERTVAPARGTRRELYICGILLLLTFAVYSQVWNHQFVLYDDPQYVTENPHVRAGLTVDGLVWAFTSGEAGNWFPLTWISHMVDCRSSAPTIAGRCTWSTFFTMRWPRCWCSWC